MFLSKMVAWAHPRASQTFGRVGLYNVVAHRDGAALPTKTFTSQKNYTN